MKILLSELEYREKTHPGYLAAFLQKGKVNQGRIEISLPDYLEISQRQWRVVQITQIKNMSDYSIRQPGDLLALLIYKLVKKRSGFCSICSNRQKQMNEWGWMGCWKNRNLITEWLISEGKKMGYSFAKDNVLSLFKLTFSERFLQRIRPFRKAETHPFYKTKLGKKIFAYVKKNLNELKIDSEKLEKEKYLIEPSHLETFLAYWETPVFLHSTKALRRLFHSAVQVPKDCRKFLCLKTNQELIEIDFSQTFPTLLLNLYDDKFCNEAEKFKELLRVGGFYNFVIKDNDLPNPKAQFMKFLFSKHAKAESLAWKLISTSLQEFPILYNKIIEKRGAAFSVELQNLEAEIFIEGVISKCMEQNIFIVPIHDGYLILEKDLPEVQKNLDQVLQKKIGYTTILKRKGI